MTRIRVLDSAAEVAAAVAEIVAAVLRARSATRLVLAGGTTPLAAYALLARESLPWGTVSVLFGDERCLAADDPETNYNLAAGALLTSARPAAVHRIPGELGAEAAADRYEAVVAAGGLDLVLLGVGTDGHTASLFPGNAALGATTLVAPVHGAAKPPPDRVTLTLRALRAASRTVLIATGADKADALRLAREGRVPAGLVDAEWLLDRAAAVHL